MLKEIKWSTNLLNYFLKKHNYDVWFQNEQSTDKKEYIDWLPIPAPEGNEKAEEGKGLKFLTPNIY